MGEYKLYPGACWVESCWSTTSDAWHVSPGIRFRFRRRFPGVPLLYDSERARSGQGGQVHGEALDGRGH